MLRIATLSSLSVTGVVSAPLWNSETSRFAGMLTVLDIIHLIQFYYRTASYDSASEDVETFRLESLRGRFLIYNLIVELSSNLFQTSKRSYK